MKKKEWDKGEFAKETVRFCIGFIVVYTITVMIIYVASAVCQLPIILDFSALTPYVYGFFGGELLFLCIKRVWAKKDDKESNDSPKDVEKFSTPDVNIITPNYQVVNRNNEEEASDIEIIEP